MRSIKFVLWCSHIKRMQRCVASMKIASQISRTRPNRQKSMLPRDLGNNFKTQPVIGEHKKTHLHHIMNNLKRLLPQQRRQLQNRGLCRNRNLTNNRRQGRSLLRLKQLLGSWSTNGSLLFFKASRKRSSFDGDNFTGCGLSLETSIIMAELHDPCCFALRFKTSIKSLQPGGSKYPRFINSCSIFSVNILSKYPRGMPAT